MVSPVYGYTSFRDIPGDIIGKKIRTLMSINMELPLGMVLLLVMIMPLGMVMPCGIVMPCLPWKRAAVSTKVQG